MNNFINEVWDVCKLPIDEISKKFKAIQIGNNIIYVSNFIRIIDYTNNHIALKVKNDFFEIIGKDLEIKQINKGEIIATGEIYCTKLGDKNE